MTLLQASLTGRAAFREVSVLLKGLTLAEASIQVSGAPYTLAEVLAHLQVTMRVSLELATGKRQSWPDGLNVWPAPPVTEADFAALHSDLSLMLAADPSSAARDLLTDLAVHNAYHWGQVALLRRMTGQDFA